MGGAEALKGGPWGVRGVGDWVRVAMCRWDGCWIRLKQHGWVQVHRMLQSTNDQLSQSTCVCITMCITKQVTHALHLERGQPLQPLNGTDLVVAELEHLELGGEVRREESGDGKEPYAMLTLPSLYSSPPPLPHLAERPQLQRCDALHRVAPQLQCFQTRKWPRRHHHPRQRRRRPLVLYGE